MSRWFYCKSLKVREKALKWTNHIQLTNDSGWEKALSLNVEFNDLQGPRVQGN